MLANSLHEQARSYIGKSDNNGLFGLNTMRQQASFYVHGHSAGGTNPSLVEAGNFGKAVLAFDCDYNRCTTEDKALFFNDAQALMRF